jgi:hypothetical protein
MIDDYHSNLKASMKALEGRTHGKSFTTFEICWPLAQYLTNVVLTDVEYIYIFILKICKFVISYEK